MSESSASLNSSPLLSALWSDYSMLLMLIVLCVVMSVVTYTEISPEGATAGKRLAADIDKEHGAAAKVMIAVRANQVDVDFGVALENQLQARGITVVAHSAGEPRDARIAIKKLVAEGKTVDVFACTKATGDWFLFEDVPEDFPTLAKAQIATPQPYKWPIFLTTNNLLNVANQIAVIAIVAIGMTIVIITGGIDLSVGSIIAFSAVSSAMLIRHFGSLEATTTTMVLSCAAAILGCGLIGLFSGVMVTSFRMPPFIVTLAIMQMASGLAYEICNGKSVFEIPPSFTWLGAEADLLGIPNAVVLMVVMYVAAHILMSRTTLGRYIYAVGGNREAARLSGVPVRSILLFAYTCSGLLAGLGGVIMASRLKSGAPKFGETYELITIAAVVVGGASLFGGRGKMFGTLIGALIIGVIGNGMNLTNVSPYRQKIVFGGVILIAVLVDTLKRRGQAGDDL